MNLRNALTLVVVIVSAGAARAEPPDVPRVAVSKDKKGFVLEPGGEPFSPWGFNYDHDDTGRLIEDYWEREWDRVEADFAQMKKLGANVVRVHLQFGKFMSAADRPDGAALDRLSKLLKLAESSRLYLNLTGLGCYHKKDVPAWYDRLSERERWGAQARFWEAVAARCARSPAVFCYDLMNEPVVPGGPRKAGDWLGPAFGDKHFVQFVTLDPKDRARSDVARRWIEHLGAAVRKVDDRHLVTVGLVDWSLDRQGLTSGFVPEKVTEKLDFVCVHLYPEAGKFGDAAETLKGFAVGKPVVVEETFPLRCAPKELDAFIEKVGPGAAGWISFYWGTPPDELRRSKQLKDAIMLDWLERFRKRVPR
ncbi:MAG: cellulase family glycosylhydrolase [Planctomycetes bacterium]|nr:cellulase family glycosylhydrolase [Planctomycetota bacterium]